MPSVTEYCAQLGRLSGIFHAAISYTRRKRAYCIIAFVAQELPKFSVKGSSCKTQATQFQ